MDTRNSQPLVLVVEDYQDAREMYAAYLSFSGYRVAEATNGVEAIEKTIELMPDIILMDLALPQMDGWGAARRAEGWRAGRGGRVGGAPEGEARRVDQAHSDRRAHGARAGGVRGGRAPGGV